MQGLDGSCRPYLSAYGGVGYPKRANHARFGALADSQFMLQLFQGHSLGLWVGEQDDEELQRHHRGEEDKGNRGGVLRQQRKCP